MSKETVRTYFLFSLIGIYPYYMGWLLITWLAPLNCYDRLLTLRVLHTLCFSFVPSCSLPFFVSPYLYKKIKFSYNNIINSIAERWWGWCWVERWNLYQNMNIFWKVINITTTKRYWVFNSMETWIIFVYEPFKPCCYDYEKEVGLWFYFDWKIVIL